MGESGYDGGPLLTGRDARRYAERVHDGVLDRYGLPLLDHVRRVAGVVPGDALTVAWLHEVLECTTITAAELRAIGVSSDEVEAIELLTRDDEIGEADYAAHIDRIARARGRSGHLARAVKRADLRDRLADERSHPSAGGQPARPDYGRALARLTHGAAVA